jgi:hypothetical protein
MKTVNPIACVTVNCKFCKSAMASKYPLMLKGVNKSINRSKLRLYLAVH